MSEISALLEPVSPTQQPLRVLHPARVPTSNAAAASRKHRIEQTEASPGEAQ
ncbi:hypothetical protein [Magnetospirillum molischianum]|uniref:hypothetical protein n=1 Tax=Magnetospirillum molischianum TaxID=1083 RepID=UPI0012DC8C2F|nr:hypothetical protein [Magnetospirillum molischianum]